MPAERFLAPVDLQAVKAAGVTFAVSAIERVIEERARGDFRRGRRQSAASSRQRIGGGIRSVVPGTRRGGALKEALIEDGMWSQYLEVAIGPDAEIFTKTAPLASVGWGAEIGVRSDSSWNNPEPEVVLVVNSQRRHPSARRSATTSTCAISKAAARFCSSKAKDNNASCAIGPFIRLFDDDFTIDDVRSARGRADDRGRGRLPARRPKPMSEISRDPDELVRQAMSEHHYPDGFALFLGTLFAPTQDRDEPGRGFTHKIGDEVRISTPSSARWSTCHDVATTRRAVDVRDRALMRNLAAARTAAAPLETDVTDTLTHFINGEAVGGEAPARASTRRTSTTSSPAIRKGGAAEVDAAVKAARAAFPGLVRCLARSPLRRARQGRRADHGAREGSRRLLSREEGKTARRRHGRGRCAPRASSNISRARRCAATARRSNRRAPASTSRPIARRSACSG